MRENSDQPVIQEQPGSPQVAPVALEEMAFAIALFFAAARGKVPMSDVQSTGFELRRELQIHSPEVASVAERLVDTAEASPDEFQLACAVTVIWHHYDGTKYREAVCSRLVAFYALMVRTKGAAIVGRSQAVEGDPASIVLEPEVIQAVATAPLTLDGQFHDLEFRRLVLNSADQQETSTSRASSEVRSGAGTRIPVTDIVQELTELLFACESTVAKHEVSGVHRFRVFEKLCRPFAQVTGAQNLAPLLSRALASTRPAYPWLRSAYVTPSGSIQGLDDAGLALHPHEALQGELALMGSFVELLRSLLGDGVTLQLLRSVWPLAFMNTDTPIPVQR